MNRKLKVKAVVFDRDGVIINTEPIVIDAVKKAFKQLGFLVHDNDIPQIIGRSADVYKEYFLRKWDFDYDEFLRIQKDVFYKNLNSAKYFEEAVELIKSLHSQRIPIAVTTSAGREGTILILEKAGVANMFKVIVTKEDCKELKPSPEPYMITAKKLDIDPKHCVAIEDTSLGVQSAKAAGMNCIAIPNEFTSDQDFSAADITLHSAAEVMEILEFE